MRVLVVDDDDFSAQIISGILRNLGFEIIRGRNGSDAMRLLLESNNSIQLVISDVYMPGMNGLELFRTIKCHPSMMRIPVVLTSGLADLNLVSEAAKIGCTQFLVKPVSREKVQAKLRELLPLHRLWIKEPKELLEELGIQTSQLHSIVERFHGQTFRVIEELRQNITTIDLAKSLKPLIESAELLGTDDLRELLGKYANHKAITSVLMRDLDDLRVEIESLRDKIVHRAREEAAMAILTRAEEKRRAKLPDDVETEILTVAGRVVRRDLANATKFIPHSARMLSHEIIGLAKGGDAQAQYEVALTYLRGYGTTINEKAGTEWLEKAAAQEHPTALVRLAVLLIQTLLLKNEAPRKEIIDLLTRASAKESSEGKYWLGQVTTDPDSLEYLQMAKLGDPKAQHKLGALYQEGLKFDANYLEAVYWLTLSAKQGYIEAEYLLGMIHLEGKIAGSSLREAASYFRAAGELDHVDAQYSLGRMYNLALGVQNDTNQAIVWYERAARQGHMKAQFELAHIWETAAGGVKPDSRQALRWYLVSAASGFAPASKKVADLQKYLPPLDLQEAETLARSTLESIGKGRL